MRKRGNTPCSWNRKSNDDDDDDDDDDSKENILEYIYRESVSPSPPSLLNKREDDEPSEKRRRRRVGCVTLPLLVRVPPLLFSRVFRRFDERNPLIITLHSFFLSFCHDSDSIKTSFFRFVFTRTVLRDPFVFYLFSRLYLSTERRTPLLLRRRHALRIEEEESSSLK